MFAGSIPVKIDALIRRIADAQLLIAQACRERDLNKAFLAFCNDPLVDLPTATARELFDRMVDGTKEYLQEYFQ